jgi:uncharacterized protein (TIGR02186 family)
MRFYSALLALLVVLTSGTAHAQPTQVSAALIDDAVLVTSSFTGAKVTVFGTVRTQGTGTTDIVVTVRGPDRPAWIGKRKRTAGLWIGEDRLYFAAAPTFFGVASSRPLEEIAPKDTLSLYGLLPLGQLDVAPQSAKSPMRRELSEAFIDQRKRQKLYVESPTSVRRLKGDLFRAVVQMPDRTPPGLYTAKVMVFRNGRPFQSTLSTLVVSKVGAERMIFEFARDHAAFYGLLGVAMAIVAGFTASSVFRRFAPG